MKRIYFLLMFANIGCVMLGWIRDYGFEIWMTNLVSAILMFQILLDKNFSKK